MLHLDFSTFPFLRTERFVLRPLDISDDGEIFALRSDDEINKYLNRQKAVNIEDARDFIRKIQQGVADNSAILWVIAAKDTDHFNGTICLWNISAKNETAELGYELLPAHHGKGIIQEIMSVVINYGFDIMKLRIIEAELSPQNIKSVKLLEKNGFVVKPGSDQSDNNNSIIYMLKNPM